MKTIFVKCLVPAALFGALMAPLSVRADSDDHHPGNINARLGHQHARIEQGERSGQLTNREARHLETRDARIKRQEWRDRRSGGGKLTGGERRHLRHELNRTSRAIYRKKHNDRVR